MLTTAQLLIFVSYITFLLVRFKKPLPSISESWYALPYGTNNLFTLFTWSLGITMVFQGGDYDTPFFFFSGAGLCFVGAATQFKWTGAGTNIIHFSGAGIGIGCALIGLWVVNGLYYPLVSFILSVLILTLLKVRNLIWWIEISAFITIIVGLYLR